MRTKKFSYRDNLGLLLVAVGVGLWLLPFAVVAVDNLIGANEPADYLIGNLGIFILTISPVLVLAGILLTVIKYLRR